MHIQHWIRWGYTGALMRMTVLILAMVTYCLMFIACDGGVIGEIPWSAVGKVVEHGTNLPIDSAWISVGDSFASVSVGDTMLYDGYADSLGEFIVGGPYGSPPNDIYAGKAGYVTTHQIIEFERGSRTVTGIIIELEKASEQTEGNNDAGREQDSDHASVVTGHNRGRPR